MITPQEAMDCSFAKVAFGGYSMQMVDDFLDRIIPDYAELYRENNTLKSKLKALTEQVEQYRSTEDAMRGAILAAQMQAHDIIADAEARRDTMIAGAEDEARAKINALHDEFVFEQKRLNAIKTATQSFVSETLATYQQQMKTLSALPDLTPEDLEADARAAAQEREKDMQLASLDALLASKRVKRKNVLLRSNTSA